MGNCLKGSGSADNKNKSGKKIVSAENDATDKIRDKFKDASEEEIQKELAQDGNMLQYLPGQLKSLSDYVNVAVRQNPLAVQYADDYLKSNSEFMQKLCERNGLVLQYASANLQGKRDFVLIAINSNPKALKYASKELKGDKEVVTTALKLDTDTFDFASVEIRRDLEMLGKVKEFWKGTSVPNAIQNDKKNALQCFTKLQWKDILCYLSEELRSDKEVVLAAMSLSWKEINFATNTLLGDEEIILKGLSLSNVDKDGEPFKISSEDLKMNEKFCLSAFKVNPYVYKYSTVLQNLEEPTKEILSIEGVFLEFASSKFKADRNLVLIAIEQNPLSLEFASPSLQDDKDVCLKAVKKDANSLAYVSERLRQNEPDIFLYSTITSATTLDYVPKDILANDKSFILKTCQYLGEVLLYISSDLQKNKEFIIEALSKNPKAYDSIPKALEKDKDVAMAAARAGFEYKNFPPYWKNDESIKQFYDIKGGTIGANNSQTAIVKNSQLVETSNYNTITEMGISTSNSQPSPDVSSTIILQKSTDLICNGEKDIISNNGNNNNINSDISTTNNNNNNSEIVNVAIKTVEKDSEIKNKNETNIVMKDMEEPIIANTIKTQDEAIADVVVGVPKVIEENNNNNIHEISNDN